MTTKKSINEVTLPTVDITYGEAPPTPETKGGFYKDLSTDVLYFKNESGAWEEKPVMPERWGVIYQSNTSE